MKKANKTVVEATVGLVYLDGGKKGLLKLTLDPQVIDGGVLDITSKEIEGQPLVRDFAGFRVSLERLLGQAK